MTSKARDVRLGDSFVALADSLHPGNDLSHRLNALIEVAVLQADVDDAAIALTEPRGVTRIHATSSERALAIAELELRTGQGPASVALVTGRLHEVVDLDPKIAEWPDLVRWAAGHGIHAAHAVPLRVRDQSIGSLTLYKESSGPIGPHSAVVQALADVTSISIVQDRELERQTKLSEQLTQALHTRITIEQAKGFIAQVLNVDVDDAFDRIRRYSRDNRLRLVDVAQSIVDRDLTF